MTPEGKKISYSEFIILKVKIHFIQSISLSFLQVKYKKDFEESKGRGFSIVSDTPEMQRLRKTQQQISNVCFFIWIMSVYVMWSVMVHLVSEQSLPLSHKHTHKMSLSSSSSSAPQLKTLALWRGASSTTLSVSEFAFIHKTKMVFELQMQLPSD